MICSSLVFIVVIDYTLINECTNNTCSCVNKKADYHAQCDYNSPRFDRFPAHAVEHWHTADMAL